MKNACSVTLILLTLSLVAPALPERNLNGTWVLTQLNGKTVPGGFVMRLSITQTGNEFAVQFDRSPNKQEYIVDGTEREFPAIGTPIRTYYSAKWNGETLVIDRRSESDLMKITMTMSTHQVWSVSSDGKNLIRSTATGFGSSFRSSPNTVQMTDVFTRVEPQ